MAEIVFIDDQQLDATSFGEFDSDSGIWKPKDVSGLTFGGNTSYYLDFENSSSRCRCIRKWKQFYCK